MANITSEKKRKTLVLGHKGASKIAPENTLRSFQKAIDLNADYIEFDIHLSKDGEIVIMHDVDTVRITGQGGLIKNMTLKELKMLDAGEGEKIPTLNELLEITRGKIKLMPEIKVRRIEEQLVSILKKNDMIESTIVTCFSHTVLKKIQKITPDIKIGAVEPLIVGREILWKDRKIIVDNTKRKNFFAIHPEYNMINHELIEYAHENDIKVNAWTVNDVEIMKKLVNWGIDGILTDDIEALNNIITG